MAGAAVTPGIALPQAINMEDLRKKVDEAAKKGTMLDVKQWMPNFLYWFTSKKPIEQRQDFMGHGGMLTIFLPRECCWRTSKVSRVSSSVPCAGFTIWRLRAGGLNPGGSGFALRLSSPAVGHVHQPAKNASMLLGAESFIRRGADGLAAVAGGFGPQRARAMITDTYNEQLQSKGSGAWAPLFQQLGPSRISLQALGQIRSNQSP